jgi:hypothetical protein
MVNEANGTRNSAMTRLTSFAIISSTTVLWVLAGFSAGGMAVVVERVITLIGGSDRFRRLMMALRARALPLLGCG